jgi:hypothetical protein
MTVTRGRRISTNTASRSGGPGASPSPWWAAPNFDETVAQAGRRKDVYLGTDRDLGLIIEIFSGTPDDRARQD